jgi:signal transduction histidine kinase
MLLQSIWGALLVQLVLSFPEGRPWSPAARVMVVAAWVAATAGPLVELFWETDPLNRIVIHPNQQLADLVSRANSALWVAIVVALLVLVVLRLLSLRGPARRTALPFLACSAAAAVLTPVWLGISAAINGPVDRLELVDRGLTLLIPIGFFLGLLWQRLRRSEASSLVVELRSAGAPSLQAQLARALGDPTLELLYRREGGGWVDGEGRPAQLPAAGGAVAVTQVLSGGEPVAALVHDPALLEDRDLVESVQATAGLVLENERLAAEVRAQLAEVRASRARIVQAADEERRRLERDLHDGAQQRLVGLSLRLRLAQAQSSEPVSAAALDQASVELEEALAELREYARGVHPTLLREDGLDAAVAALARRASVPVTVEGAVDARLPDTVELAAYFFVSEALANVAKHAQASAATVRVSRPGGLLRVSVADDGVGGADSRGGSGLAGLADRLAAVDGVLHVESDSGHGTTLVAEIPCAW